MAALGLARFERSGLALVGSLRRDGSPRISPVEPYVVAGELALGMMPNSRKALDLLRDPRLTVHSTACDRDGSEGDFKVYGQAFDVPDAVLRKAYGDATEARIDWRPEGPFHLFVVDIESAGYIEFGEGRRAMRWTRSGGFQRLRHPDD
ncbi:pyridoxamine 5'-phosphate oxidase family protein [soil metagenome]